MKKTSKVDSNVYKLDGRVPLRQAIPLGMQHVLAMFVGNLSPMLVLFGICGITADAGLGALRVSLLQNAMFIAGVVTVLQLYPLGPVGARLPIVMGTSSGFIGINKAIAVSMMAGVAAGAITTSAEAGIYAYGAVMGASLVGGIFEGALGFCLKPLRRFFPSVVTGTVVMAIGFSLIDVGIGFFGGGRSSSDYGSPANICLALFTLIVIIVCKHGRSKFASASSILVGILAGYVASFVMSLFMPTVFLSEGVTKTCSWVTRWNEVKDASWFALPDIMPVALQFNIRAILPMLLMFIVTAVETIGDTSGITESGLGREATDKELSGAVICDGLGSTLAALFGVMPNTSFSQNVGMVGITKVVNRFCIFTGAVFLMLTGLFPKLGAVLSAMPQPVLGGAAVFMFASILVSGMSLITKEPLSSRNITIVSVSLGLGFGIGNSPAILSSMPQWVFYIFGESGIVPAALISVILNIVLPAGKESPGK